MRNYLLGGIAIAGVVTLMIPIAPASAQGGCPIGQTCGNHRVVGAGPTQRRYDHPAYARGDRRGYGVGAGVAAGLAAGAIVGGAIEQNQGYYYPDQSYPVYSDQGPDEDAGAVVVGDADSVAYCERTYRSYDPASGTYLGYDGFRHPCP